MPPGWVAKDASLADDERLSELQLRWFRDDLWMRRIAFFIRVVLTLATAVLLILQPFPHAFGAGLFAGPLGFIGFWLWRRHGSVGKSAIAVTDDDR